LLQSAFLWTALSAETGRKALTYVLNLGHWLPWNTNWCSNAAHSKKGNVSFASLVFTYTYHFCHNFSLERKRTINKKYV